ncbi:MAG: hypothetical protein A2275_11880 [Bacteroidetes bacterium RIFOXYA12_FULL_35_11]|nr:MAG: hypothetical protein A2X01_21040 [Bacteroidetes bacterium GWF2_35_48]OFY81566.1 MAG: hypothetical protein A2275_11880 [Bacteroidetes bacterium RIFOXYA12_FULL_35_11]OFY94418.1 MAG: hypothetical protein A2491_00325 [Bacteroidetes bacterium RIFOXYC12_FULL_35_7]
MKSIGIILISFFLYQCKGPETKTYIFIEGRTQGTTFHITYASYDSTHYGKEIDSILNRIDNSLSVYNPSSVVSSLNKNLYDTVSDLYFLETFRNALDVSEATFGAFDVTVAPLVNAWGFGFKNKIRLDSLKVDSLLSLVGFKKIEFKDNKIIKKDPRVQMDFNAIAQGYTVDVIVRFFESKKVSDYLVEIGGEVRGKGVNKKGLSWRIGIDKPLDASTEETRELQAIVSLNNKAIATSGSYRKFYEENGIRYSHTIDPSTGYPVRHNLLSVSVLADDASTADAYATAFMVMGIEKSLDFLKKQNKLEAYFICSKGKDYEIQVTDGFKNLIEKDEEKK